MNTEYDDTDRRAAEREAYEERIMPRPRQEITVPCIDPWCSKAGTFHTIVLSVRKY